MEENTLKMNRRSFLILIVLPYLSKIKNKSDDLKFEFSRPIDYDAIKHIFKFPIGELKTIRESYAIIKPDRIIKYSVENGSITNYSEEA